MCSSVREAMYDPPEQRSVAFAAGDDISMTTADDVSEAGSTGTNCLAFASTGHKRGGRVYASGAGAYARVKACSNQADMEPQSPPVVGFNYRTTMSIVVVVLALCLVTGLKDARKSSEETKETSHTESFWEENAAQDPVCHQFKLLPNHTMTHKNGMVILVEPEIENTPRHTLVKKSDRARLNCSRISGSDHRIQWWVSINNTSPSLISDGDVLLDHFNQSRYEIEQLDEDTFNLVIEDVQISDAGTYICYDGTMGGSPRMVTNQKDGFKLKDIVGEAKAELIVIESLPVCESSVGVSGRVVENDSHTVECLFTIYGNLRAQHTWNRPELSKSSNGSTDWSGIQFTVDPSINNATMSVEITFDEDVYAAGEDSVRPWSYTYTTPKLEVNWRPRNITFLPWNKQYYVGDTIRCSASARPPAKITWMKNDMSINSENFTVTKNMVGTTTQLRCKAVNTIEDRKYTATQLISVSVIDCPKDFVHVPWLNNSCYQFVTRKAHRGDADEYCGGLAEGAHLATIDDDMERDVLMSHLSSQDMGDCQKVFVNNLESSTCGGAGFQLNPTSNNEFAWVKCIRNEKCCSICELETNTSLMVRLKKILRQWWPFRRLM